ncbi:2,6-dihydropseudooxynicotine hydrolase [Sporomusa ovata DSM 2662]|uniref:Alpha/beta superfamily hydrolase n=1 Tax=Sporomusa ovata TaxID=2378 RepID=A0A0U1L5H7_9FIRM|nr:alpha/beta fold hydrolase [Sporomusa ovata]EQB28610.1 lysophospholipase [Sporomusa ovata DSM 2662]CQR74942.1 Alpha/beta superfamily hydrolase [Sporomusa ovata]
MKSKINFKKGTFNFHPNPNFNYQLNRTYAWSNGDLEELKAVAKRITNAETWEKEFLQIAEKALKEKRIEQAIAYFRMAEFFMYDGHPAKFDTYDKAVNLFYNYHADLFKSGIIKKDSVPFGTAHLPVLYTEPEMKKYIDTILLHGGYDSYMEEFVPMMLYLRENGFAVYLFEGPGQGGALRKEGLTFIPEWEKPVREILDYYNLNDVTIIGLSLGGMLAPRAAAFENRIKRVVAWSLLPNLFDLLIYDMPKKFQDVIRLLMTTGDENLLNLLIKSLMEKEPLIEWAINHGMHNMGVHTPYEYLRKINQFQYLDIGMKITQDFLLLGAEKDHFIPVEFYKPIIDCLHNVKSLTYRLFTEKESAENHCNAGNAKLVLDTIITWIKVIKPA